MKIVHSSLLRAFLAVVIGILLVVYSEDAMGWLTKTIGILFFLSGIISCATYYGVKNYKSDVQVFNANREPVITTAPSFPVVGLGSIILGIILFFMSAAFITWVMYILAIIIILGAINQFVNLASIMKATQIGIFYWITPSLLMLVAIFILLHPMESASVPLIILGWCIMIYGVTECIQVLKINAIKNRVKAAKDAYDEAEAKDLQEIKDNAEVKDQESNS